MSHRAIAASILTIPALILGSGCSGGDGSAATTPTTSTGNASGEPEAPIAFTAACTGSDQQCNNQVLVPFELEQGLQAATAKVTRGPGHCSSTAYLVSVDGGEATSTEFTSYVGGPAGLPDTVTVNLGALESGVHELHITGLGQTGGCNGGSILSFGGSVELPKAASPAGEVSTGPS